MSEKTIAEMTLGEFFEALREGDAGESRWKEMALMAQKELEQEREENERLRGQVRTQASNLKYRGKEIDRLEAQLADARLVISEIANWPDGGIRYGQASIKRYTADFLAEPSPPNPTTVPTLEEVDPDRLYVKAESTGVATDARGVPTMEDAEAVRVPRGSLGRTLHRIQTTCCYDFREAQYVKALESALKESEAKR